MTPRVIELEWCVTSQQQNIWDLILGLLVTGRGWEGGRVNGQGGGAVVSIT